MAARPKLLNDPVYGFIQLRHADFTDVMDHPWVQRLRRISQLGLSHLVYPGAVHNRFHHAVGAMFLMQEALDSLREKGIVITEEEYRGACLAILLHDVGHGPFSHALEHTIVSGVHHEEISTLIMNALNDHFGGKLDVAISIFNDHHPKGFLHDLVSSQLDMDRMDYLRRDSFFTGVSEGMISSERIIRMLNVHEGRLVVDEKGIYSIEKFIISRRLMYWQVYLHKTVIAGDQVLRSVIRRVRFWLQQGENRQVAGASEPFLYFLKKGFSGLDVHEAEVQDAFVALDDADILFSLKRWMSSPDAILADLSRRFLERDFFRVDYQVDSERLAPETLADAVATLLLDSGLSTPEHIDRDLSFYLLRAQSSHEAYDTREDVIAVLNRAGRIEELSVTEDVMVIEPLAEQQIRPYVCYPKEALSS